MTTQKTRCPYCSSVFAVSNAQLAIRDGYTRCGKCFQVFKADDYLITAKGSETDEKASDNKNRSHIVDLHKIGATKSKGFDTALDSFLDKTATEPQSAEEPTGIDFEHSKKERIDLSIIPNPHPAPDHQTPETLASSIATIPEVTPIQTSSHSLGQEFNEEWLNETTPSTNDTNATEHLVSNAPIVKTQNQPNVSTISNSNSAENENKADDKDSQDIDDDLMGYLNKNSVPAASTTKVKAERVLPGMNDFHAAQRSKKKSTALPMHFHAPKRNATLDRLTARRPWLNINFLHILGWSILSLLMVALLATQYVYFNFDQLAANPRYQPIMHKACLRLGCDVPLIDIQKIKISKAIARHYQPDPQEATLFTATMTNTADESQPYPTLRLLVLKDKQVLSGRALRPSEYLTSGYNSLARIAPNTPVQIEFVLKIPREQIPVFALDPVR